MLCEAPLRRRKVDWAANTASGPRLRLPRRRCHRGPRRGPSSRVGHRRAAEGAVHRRAAASPSRSGRRRLRFQGEPPGPGPRLAARGAACRRARAPTSAAEAGRPATPPPPAAAKTKKPPYTFAGGRVEHLPGIRTFVLTLPDGRGELVDGDSVEPASQTTRETLRLPAQLEPNKCQASKVKQDGTKFLRGAPAVF